MLDRLFDLVWPRPCEICGRPTDRPGRHVCSECLMRLPFLPVRGNCRCCGRDVPTLSVEYLCEDCARNKPFFDRAASAFRFEGEARRMLLDFKFNRHLWLRTDFTDWLEATLRARFDVTGIDCVVPVPTTVFHRLDRGYNQSAILARALAKRLARPCSCAALGRVGHPRRQGGLDEAARRENAKGSFRVRQARVVKGRCILLVDDVMTTGATLSECARVLKLAGATRVWTITLARSVRS